MVKNFKYSLDHKILFKKNENELHIIFMMKGLNYYIILFMGIIFISIPILYAQIETEKLIIISISMIGMWVFGILAIFLSQSKLHLQFERETNNFKIMKTIFGYNFSIKSFENFDYELLNIKDKVVNSAGNKIGIKKAVYYGDNTLIFDIREPSNKKRVSAQWIMNFIVEFFNQRK